MNHDFDRTKSEGSPGIPVPYSVWNKVCVSNQDLDSRKDFCIQIRNHGGRSDNPFRTFYRTDSILSMIPNVDMGPLHTSELLYLDQVDNPNLQYHHACKFDVSVEHHHHSFWNKVSNCTILSNADTRQRNRVLFFLFLHPLNIRHHPLFHWGILSLI